jgi:hypothetical protein
MRSAWIGSVMNRANTTITVWVFQILRLPSNAEYLRKSRIHWIFQLEKDLDRGKKALDFCFH